MNSAVSSFTECVHCGLCLESCPTYRELGTEADSPRGRIYLIKALRDGSLSLNDEVVNHLDLCLGCRACESACPSGVRYSSLLESARVEIDKTYRRSWWQVLRQRALDFFIPHRDRLRLLLAPLFLLERSGVLAIFRRYNATLRMLPQLSRYQAIPKEVRCSGSARQRTQFFRGCIADILFNEVNHATLRVLTRNSCDVATPHEQVCCGALYLHSGAIEKAKSCARENIDAFGAGDDVIITNAAGCGAMLKEYGELLQHDEYRDRAKDFSSRVRDISEYLVESEFHHPEKGPAMSLTYHDACHLAHAQGIRQAPREILAAIPGIELREMEDSDRCCGSAGSYNLSQPEMARRIGREKAQSIDQTGAACVAVGNPGCAMQIRAMIGETAKSIEVLHPVQILDRAYRMESEK